MNQLILTVTRACNLRCSYCPTAKDGWPSLSEEDARAAVRLFARDFGGGSLKLFGGEPLLRPSVVRAAMDAARDESSIRWVYLSTNGLGLDAEWLRYLQAYPKGILTVSMDGLPEFHRAERVPVSERVGDTYDHILSIKDALLDTPRVVITQTIAPSKAVHAARNFEHLLSLGFWRFNFLPGYYIRWTEPQLEELSSAFTAILNQIKIRWENGQRTYVRNLFTWAPTAFFNTGLVVDADRTIHPSNVGLSGALDHLREQTVVGDLDSPPTPSELRRKAQEVNDLLTSALDSEVLWSTQAADRCLSMFCRELYPHWAASKRSGSAA